MFSLFPEWNSTYDEHQEESFDDFPWELTPWGYPVSKSGNHQQTEMTRINDISSQCFFFCKSLKKNPNWRQPVCHIKDSIWYITQQIPESKYKSSWHKLSRVVKSVAHHSSKHGTCYCNNCTMNSNIWDVFILSMVCLQVT